MWIFETDTPHRVLEKQSIGVFRGFSTSQWCFSLLSFLELIITQKHCNLPTKQHSSHNHQDLQVFQQVLQSRKTIIAVHPLNQDANSAAAAASIVRSGNCAARGI
jgi:hypothetical protein